jgi:hypothetical protein
MLVAAGVLFAGCGEQEDFANEPRPPATAQLSARIDDRGVEIAPTRIGAGMAIVTISNQSDESTQLRFIGPTRRSTDEIPAGGTGNLQLELEPGRYEVEPSSDTLAATTLRVGPPRPSAKNELQLP